MKKRTKRIVTLIAAIMMVLSTTLVAFAAGEGTSKKDEGKKVEISNIVINVLLPNGKESDIEKIVKNPYDDSADRYWFHDERFKCTLSYNENDVVSYDVSKNVSGKKLKDVKLEDVITLNFKDSDLLAAINEKTNNTPIAYTADSYEVKLLAVKFIYNSWHIDAMIDVKQEEETTTAPAESTTLATVTVDVKWKESAVLNSYSSIEYYSEKTSVIKMADTGYYGLVDAKGNVVIQPAASQYSANSSVSTSGRVVYSEPSINTSTA